MTGSIVMRAFLAVSVVAMAAEAATYHVNPSSGQDSPGASGASTQPWRTINYAISRVGPGDIITLAGGSTTVEKVYFAPADSGAPGRPITLRSDAADPGTIQAPDNASQACFIYNAGHLVFENLRFTGAGMDISNSDGVSVFCDDRQHDSLTFRNVTVSGFGRAGLVIGGWNGAVAGFRHVLVENSTFRDNRRGGMGTYAQDPAANRDFVVRDCKAYNNLGDPTYTSSHSGSGIVISGVTGAVVEYCVAYNNGERCSTTGGPVGIWAYDATNVVIQYCEAYNNHAINCDGGGFDLDGGCQNSVIQYCYSHDNDGAGYLICQYDGARAFTANVVRYNISQNDGRRNGFGGIHFWSSGANGGIVNTIIYGNTIYNQYSHVLRFQNTSGQSGTKLLNNIFISAGGQKLVDGAPGTSVALFQGNCYWPSGGAFSAAGYASLAAWRSGASQEKRGTDTTGMHANPMVDSAGKGVTVGNARQLTTLLAYRLQATSPCINRGLDIQALFGVTPGPRDFYGNAVPRGIALDIGANEAEPQTASRETVADGAVRPRSERTIRATTISGRAVPGAFAELASRHAAQVLVGTRAHGGAHVTVER